jgi:hypothetical protein
LDAGEASPFAPRPSEARLIADPSITATYEPSADKRDRFLLTANQSPTEQTLAATAQLGERKNAQRASPLFADHPTKDGGWGLKTINESTS